MSRKQIRDQIKTQLATSYTGTIFTGRKIDARDQTEFVNVFLADGVTEEDTVLRQTESTLVIGVHKQNATDDQLDTIGDLLEAAIATDISLGGLVAGLVYTGFEYGEDERNGFDQLYLKYTVIF